MKLNCRSSFCRGLLAAIVLLACSSAASAQYLRTSYFMDVAQYRLQLNPAMAPVKGFVHLPGIGHVNAAMRSNSLGLEDVVDIIKNKDDADRFFEKALAYGLVDVNGSYHIADKKLPNGTVKVESLSDYNIMTQIMKPELDNDYNKGYYVIHFYYFA